MSNRLTKDHTEMTMILQKDHIEMTMILHKILIQQRMTSGYYNHTVVTDTHYCVSRFYFTAMSLLMGDVDQLPILNQSQEILAANIDRYIP